MAFADGSNRTVTFGYGPVQATLGGTVQAGDLVYNSAGTWYQADADNSRPADAVAGEYGESADKITVYKLAYVEGFTGGTAAGALYLSETAGGYASAAPGATASIKQIVGNLSSATGGWVQPVTFSTDYGYIALQFGVTGTGLTTDTKAVGVAGDIVRAIFYNGAGAALSSAPKIAPAGIGTAIAECGTSTLANGGTSNVTTIASGGTNMAAAKLLTFTVGSSGGKRQPQSCTVIVRFKKASSM